MRAYTTFPTTKGFLSNLAFCLYTSITVFYVQGALFKVQAATACDIEETTVNIVAHQDDGILFLNPDILYDIQKGKCVSTVYLTAGDANQDTNYWMSREEGAKNAYANMSGVSNSWSETDFFSLSHSIAVYNLDENPKISLVFMRLPDGNIDGSGFSNNNYESLQKIWENTIPVIHSVDNSTVYFKEDIIYTLVDILIYFQPGLIRTQNFKDAYSSMDHSDHYTTAYIAKAASEQYNQNHSLKGYLGYEISSSSANLSDTETSLKQSAFLAYVPYDSFVCQTLNTCQQVDYGSWLERQYTVDTQDAPNLSSTGELLTEGTWTLSGSNGSEEEDKQIPTNSLLNKKFVEVDFNLHGSEFGYGSDEASVIFIQNSSWYAANIVSYAENGKDGFQTITIPLSDFHKIGDASADLNLTGSVSSLHTRFWNSNDFTVDLTSIKLTDDNEVTTPNPDIDPDPIVDPEEDPKVDPDPIITSSNELLNDGARNLSGSNGSDEEDKQIPTNSLNKMESVKVTFDLNGTQFGYGSDEASVIFIQNSSWYAANIIPYAENGKEGTQSVTIPLDAFYKIGSASEILDTTDTVTNLHMRFWNSGTFSVDIESVSLTQDSSDSQEVPVKEQDTTVEPAPEPDPAIEPGDTGELLVDDTWNFSGTNGSDEEDMQIPSNSLSGMRSVKVVFDLKDNTFGTGDDEASIIFIQDNEWYVVNLIPYAENGKDGSQTVTIPLTEFHKVGDSSEKLDLSKSVTNLHARFWSSSTFSVEFTSVRLLSDL
ncbi:PIG-L family deacetylase [Patescibacteria group bacterium]